MEVAEHITTENSEKFIKYLTDKAPVILFSAAIPNQGGTNHINEQWLEFWEEIFKKNNYKLIDCIRDKIWRNDNVEMWYIQNIFIFVENDYLQKNEILKNELKTHNISPYSIIHPKLYLYIRDSYSDKEVGLRKELENVKTDLFNRLNNLNQAYENLNQAYENLNQAYENLNQAYENLNQAYENQKQKYENQKQKYENQKQKYENQKQKYEKKLLLKEKHIQKIISSNSWKITKHPRKFLAWVRNIKKS